MVSCIDSFAILINNIQSFICMDEQWMTPANKWVHHVLRLVMGSIPSPDNVTDNLMSFYLLIAIYGWPSELHACLVYSDAAVPQSKVVSSDG